MKTVALVATLMAVLFAPVQHVLAQTPEMPFPNLVLKDADGKVIAPITVDPQLWIVLDIDDLPAFLTVNLQTGQILRKTVYFSGADCTGDAYLYPPGTTYWWDEYTQTSFGVVGPDPDDGTYRLFRTTSANSSSTYPLSRWDENVNECRPETGSRNISPAEEVIPNPLEGYHGPTTANPERLLTVAGGTRLP